MALTAKQLRFVEEYLVDSNATQAAVRAGYSPRTAHSIGHENLTKPEIAEEISRRKAEVSAKIADKLEITKERIVEELARLGFSNALDYMRITADGDPMIDLSNMTRDQAAALTEFTVEDFTEGRGDDARDVRRVKIKLADKRGALVDLAKLLGFHVEKVEHTGRDGRPIQTEDKSSIEIARAIAFLLTRAARETGAAKEPTS